MADQVQVRSQARGSISTLPTSLYVGDLDVNVDDSQLHDLFNQIGQVSTVKVCRNLTTHRSLGYGYVNYIKPQGAARALNVLNFTPLNQKPIRVIQRDPSIRKSGAGNIYIKNLDKSVDHKALYDTFSSIGNILLCKVATDASGQSKGCGFVQFQKQESAQNAIDQLNGTLINDKKVYVGHFLHKQERGTAGNNTKFNNGGFGYLQQLVCGMRPGNFLVPMGRRGQGQRPGERHGAGPPISVMQQQVGMSHSFGSLGVGPNRDRASDGVARGTEGQGGGGYEGSVHGK